MSEDNNHQDEQQTSMISEWCHMRSFERTSIYNGPEKEESIGSFIHFDNWYISNDLYFILEAIEILDLFLTNFYILIMGFWGFTAE